MIQNIHAHRGLAKISSCLSQNWGEVGKKVLLYSIFIFTSQISIASEEIVATTVIEVASETFTQISEAVAPAWGVLSWIKLGVQVCSVAVEIKSYFIPNKEEESQVVGARKKLKVDTARSKFKHCLIANKLNSEINASGFPANCEELAHIFVACGGKNELIDMTSIFNERKGRAKIS